MSIYDSDIVRVFNNDVPYIVGIDVGDGMPMSGILEQDPSITNTFVGYRIDG